MDCVTPGLCEWCIRECCDPSQPIPEDVAGWSQQMAKEILYDLSGRQFGVCIAVERPCPSRPCDGYGVGYNLDVVGTQQGWSLVTQHCGCARRSCECRDRPTVRLARRPIVEVLEVKIDGAILDPSHYALARTPHGRGMRVLARTDGAPWPSCNDRFAPDTETGVWSITYKYGNPVPTGGQIAAGILACELAKACLGDDTCRLPQRIQTRSVNGQTVGFLDKLDVIKDGRTGIAEIDQWLVAVNPAGLRRRAKVFAVRV